MRSARPDACASSSRRCVTRRPTRSPSAAAACRIRSARWGVAARPSGPCRARGHRSVGRGGFPPVWRHPRGPRCPRRASVRRRGRRGARRRTGLLAARPWRGGSPASLEATPGRAGPAVRAGPTGWSRPRCRRTGQLPRHRPPTPGARPATAGTPPIGRCGEEFEAQLDGEADAAATAERPQCLTVHLVVGVLGGQPDATGAVDVGHRQQCVRRQAESGGEPPTPPPNV